MSVLATALAVAALAAAPQSPPEEPSPERVAAAVEALRAAFGRGDSAARLEAIQAASEVVHEDVVALVAKGIKDSDEVVRDASIEALRRMPHEDALDALHATYKRDRSIKKSPESYARLLRAIAQHGSEGSLRYLTDGSLTGSDYIVARARILGLAGIRSPKSVEALMDMMRSAGRHQVQVYMDDLRLALQALTGVDQGKVQDAWFAWWNDNKKKVVVAPELPPLPKDARRRWDVFWGNRYANQRQRKRGDRGRDPEGSE